MKANALFIHSYLLVLKFHSKYTAGRRAAILTTLFLEAAGLFTLAMALSLLFVSLSGAINVPEQVVVRFPWVNDWVVLLATTLGLAGALVTYASELMKVRYASQMGMEEFIALGAVSVSHEDESLDEVQSASEPRIFGGPLHYVRAATTFIGLAVPIACIVFSILCLHFFLRPTVIWFNLMLIILLSLFYLSGLRRVEEVETQFRRSKAAYFRSKSIPLADNINEWFRRRNTVQASNRMRMRALLFVLIALIFAQATAGLFGPLVDSDLGSDYHFYIAVLAQLLVLSVIRAASTVSQSVRFFPFIAQRLMGNVDDADDED